MSNKISDKQIIKETKKEICFRSKTKGLHICRLDDKTNKISTLENKKKPRHKDIHPILHHTTAKTLRIIHDAKINWMIRKIKSKIYQTVFYLPCLLCALALETAILSSSYWVRTLSHHKHSCLMACRFCSSRSFSVTSISPVAFFN